VRSDVLRMKRVSGRKYVLPSAELLRNWRQQAPSNQGDTDSRVTREVGTVHYTGGDTVSDFFSVP
jgi:hypothetical protein